MIIIASSNGAVGMPAAWEILQSGGSALDAIEVATRLVEDNPDDHSVGYGGYPNLLGEVELDASIMDGETLRSGAVGALRGYRHPISVARRVMDELPHVMLVGEGAARFAAELGMQAENLLSEEAERTWRAGIEGRDMINWHGVSEQVAKLLSRAASVTKDPEHVTGTVNFIAQDSQGRIASAVSTSGWAWKYPGRLGDSPIIGAGNYADNRYGAAACTGHGEMAMRCATAHSVVLYMKMGMTLEQALREAMTDLKSLGGPWTSRMNIIALDRDGTPSAASNNDDATFIYMREDMDDYVEAPRLYVP